MNRLFGLTCIAALSLATSGPGWSAEPKPDLQPRFAALQQKFAADTQPLIRKFCLDCHSTAEQQGELDLERFRSLSEIRGDIAPWQRVWEQVQLREMPPKDAPSQPTDAERAALLEWVKAVLDTEALSQAGDPGPVVLRRLNNAEYTYSIQELTGLPLTPAREFPTDSAAGEGFTNVGDALVMSPSLVQKYLDASKEIASHLVLLPDGIGFSESTTSRDWTNEKLKTIQQFYARYTDQGGATAVNLQGVQFETNGGGRLPLERYLSVLIASRATLQSGQTSLAEIAQEQQLSEKYLTSLWTALTGEQPSLILDGIRVRWKTATPADVPALVAEIQQWQQALWRFSTIGHIGKRDGPPAWQIPVVPVATQQEILVPLPPADDQGLVTFYLTTADLGDGHEQDFAVWQRPRFIIPGQPDLFLRDVPRTLTHLERYRQQLFQHTSAALAAVAEISSSPDSADITAISSRHGVAPELVASWMQYLGVGAGPVVIAEPLQRKLERVENYDFVRGWVSDDALSILANSSDQPVRIPGDLSPHSVGVHPAPGFRVAMGWKSPLTGTVKVSGRVQRAHLACGNGVTWHLELRRGQVRQRLAAGVAGGSEASDIAPLENLPVRAGDLLSLVIGPRDGSHVCDMTAIQFQIAADQAGRNWDLGQDVSTDILAGNPHADRYGNSEVWHFYREPTSLAEGAGTIPQGSLLAQWQLTAGREEKQQLAKRLQALLRTGADKPAAETPDALLIRELTNVRGPLYAAAWASLPTSQNAVASDDSTNFGLALESFGQHPQGASVEAGDLCVQAPSVMEVKVPAQLVAGAKFAATGQLHAATARQGTVQLSVEATRRSDLSRPRPSTFQPVGGKTTWSDGEQALAFASPILMSPESAARDRVVTQLDEFRQLFPAALCYTKIVPVDEVVTLTLYYREDDQLRRLMLSETESADLDRLWNELHYVSRSALAQVDAYEQLWQYATQDADPSAFTPMREGILQRAEDFRKLLQASEPQQVAALIAFADRAWRRPLTAQEQVELQQLYQTLRQEELSHEDATRMLLTRILLAPAFLYRGERPNPGTEPTPVDDWELASRLSFFLWSAPPDDQLRQRAASGELQRSDVLIAESRRLLQDARIRRLAVEFGCQWLHIRDFDQFDEKSAQHFPEFTDLRDDMYEEAICYFEDLFRRDGSVLELFDSDHTFANEPLAAFYGLPNVQGQEWRRVEGTRVHGRGGILTMAATLAKQSGASRTSPILRGNWVSEFLLGEKLPRPPKDVPLLPEEVPAELTERQLTERHSSDPACAKCHRRIDGFGFSLEQFDGIGRWRTKDAGGHAIDVVAVLPDGSPVDGVAGLRNYLLQQRRDDVLRTFCRRLLGYALGRPVQLSDGPLLDAMLTNLQAHEFRVSAAIETIVLSPQFRQIRGRDNRIASDADSVP